MRRCLLLFLGPVLACGGTEPGALPSTQSPADASAATVEIGKGAEAFSPLADDERLELVMAPQTGGFGIGQHFDIALRATNVAPKDVVVHVTIDDGTDVVSDVTTTLNLAEAPGEQEGFVGAGVRANVDGCFVVVDRALTIRIDVTDTDQKTASATKSVRGPEACPRNAG